MSGKPLRVLVLAYYFPPMGLSGVQRTAGLVRYLPHAGWEPVVLTVAPGSYYAFDQTLVEPIEAAGIPVIRTPSNDPLHLPGMPRKVRFTERKRRLLAMLNQALYIPDNKIGWRKFAIPEGLRLIKQYGIDLIFSTAPPYSAHLIGLALSKQTGLPLVTDFRDPWLENPRHTYITPYHYRKHRQLERQVLTYSDAITVVNRVLQSWMIKKLSDVMAFNRVRVIPHGYLAEDWHRPPTSSKNSEHLVFLYAGSFYHAQKPDYFLRALRSVFDRYPHWQSFIRAHFVGTLPPTFNQKVAQWHLHDSVIASGYLSYRDTIQAIQSADVLWLTVGHQRGEEVLSLSKTGMYIGSGKPILALVPDGAAKDILNAYRATYFADPENVQQIADQIIQVVHDWQKGQLKTPNPAIIEQYEMRRIAMELARVFGEQLYVA